MTESAFPAGHIVTASEFNAKLQAPILTAELTAGLITPTELAALAVTGAKLGAQIQGGAYNAFDQSINNITATIASLPLTLYDNDTIHDVSVNPTRLTCRTAGLYLVLGVGAWAANATGYRLMYLQVNGSDVIARDTRVSVSAVDVTAQHVSRLWRFSVNDYAELGVYQSSGGALSLRGLADYSAQLSMVRIGGL